MATKDKLPSYAEIWGAPAPAFAKPTRKVAKPAAKKPATRKKQGRRK